MRLIERSHCDVVEYKNSLDGLVMPESLCLNAMYMLNLSLKSSVQGKQAVRLPALVENVVSCEASNLSKVDFTPLDTDTLQPLEPQEVLFRDGFWVNVAGRFTSIEQRAIVETGFFEDFDFGVLRPDQR